MNTLLVARCPSAPADPDGAIVDAQAARRPAPAPPLFTKANIYAVAMMEGSIADACEGGRQSALLKRYRDAASQGGRSPPREVIGRIGQPAPVSRSSSVEGSEGFEARTRRGTHAVSARRSMRSATRHRRARARRRLARPLQAGARRRRRLRR